MQFTTGLEEDQSRQTQDPQAGSQARLAFGVHGDHPAEGVVLAGEGLQLRPEQPAGLAAGSPELHQEKAGFAPEDPVEPRLVDVGQRARRNHPSRRISS